MMREGLWVRPLRTTGGNGLRVNTEEEASAGRKAQERRAHRVGEESDRQLPIPSVSGEYGPGKGNGAGDEAVDAERREGTGLEVASQEP
jgi:hypothetical protein